MPPAGLEAIVEHSPGKKPEDRRVAGAQGKDRHLPWA
jgi:hypothetical protein